jgi:hypothetical protein
MERGLSLFNNKIEAFGYVIISNEESQCRVKRLCLWSTDRTMFFEWDSRMIQKISNEARKSQKNNTFSIILLLMKKSCDPNLN